MLSPRHIPVLDLLRGLAAASVCFFHFTNGNPSFLPDGDQVKVVGSFGWLGVEAFFVISGFVIPYSLFCRASQPDSIGSFLMRRLKRLEPPFLASICVVLVLQYFSSLAPGFRGSPLDVSWQQLLAHLGYLNAILDYGWLNPVYWTLAIEFQFYIFIAIVFPLISHPKLPVRELSVLGIALLGLAGLENRSLLFHWLPLFAIGIATSQAFVGSLPSSRCLILMVGILVVCDHVVGWQQTATGLLTAGTIYFVGTRRLPGWLQPIASTGMISYSLYLLHVPIGGRVINLASRLPDTPGLRYLAIVIAFGVSLAASYVFWRCIERTSQRWAKSSTMQGTVRDSFLAQSTRLDDQPSI